MSQSPDGRTSSDGSCFECLSPSGSSAGSGWGTWIKGGTNSMTGTFAWMWQPTSPPPPQNPYDRTTPGRSPSVSVDTPGGAFANPVQFSSPGVGNAAPNAGAPLTVSGGSGSTGNPIVDVNRVVSGQVPGTSVVFNSRG
jgi:hypothetical protein